MERTEKTITEMTKTIEVVREKERESNRLEKVALICDAKNNEYNTENIDKNSSKNKGKIQNNSKESTLLVCAKSAYKREVIKEDKQKRIDYIANRRKEKLLFTG